MKKADLIHRLSARTGLTQKDVTILLAALKDEIIQLYNSEDSVSLPGLGTFKVKTRAARKGRNPRTGEMFDIHAHRVVCFKPVASLKRVQSTL